MGGIRNIPILRRAVVIAMALSALTAVSSVSASAHAFSAQAPIARAGASARLTGCDVWGIVPSPNSNQRPDSRLLSVSALSPANAWAVGLTSDPDSLALTLTERWEHGTWHIVPSPNPTPNFQSQLDGVAMVSPHDVWAVGGNLFISNKQFETRTLIEHWNGKLWRIVASPNPSPVFSRLTSLAAITANDVWAVGEYLGSAGLIVPLAEHWDGRAWHVVPTAPLPTTTSGTFTSITSIRGTKHLWAVGSTVRLPRPSFDQGLIEQWNGRAWQIIQNGSPEGAKSSELNEVVTLSRTDAWAVGDATPTNSSLREPLVEHWNGRSWSAVPSPLPRFASGGVLGSVAATNPRDVRIVGSFFAPDTGARQVWFQRWDGRQWHLTPSPTPSGALGIDIRALTADRAGNFWAVGDSFDNATHLFQTLTERSSKCR